MDPSLSRNSSAGLDFTLHVERLCDDLVARLAELRHIDMSRVAVVFAQTRRQGDIGMHASLTPLRFPGGQTQTCRRGRRWGIQRVSVGGREMLYILRFYLPRFFDLPLREKLITVVHELWHISPQCDGDVRRFAGRCHQHSGSKRRYDAEMDRLVERWLAQEPPLALYEFLNYDFRGLVAAYGAVHGRKIPAPKLYPLE